MSAVLQSPLSQFLPVIGEPIDVFLCSASFETRCLAIANEIPSTMPRKVFVVENEDFPIVGENAARIHHRFGGIAERVGVRTDDPLRSADGLGEALSRVAHEGTGTCVIDISTFTHEHLLILLAMLKAKPLPERVKFVYTGAAEYMLGDEKWLSRGIGDIRSVLGFPGMLRPSRDLHLIVLVGFEVERAQQLARAYSPRMVSLGYAAPQDSISATLSSTNQAFHRTLVEELGAVESFTFSSRDPVATKEAIAAQVQKFHEYGAVVAPLNTKVSTIGAGLAAFENPSIQLCYAQAMRYNIKGYSRPGDTFLLVDVPGITAL